MAPILGYWNIRGLAQPIRLLLAYTETDFEDKYYTCGPAPTYDRSDWLKEKFTLGLDFPNLPYYIDGPVKISQSNAIIRYIARKHKLDGATESEKLRIDIAELQLVDFRSKFVGFCYNPNFENLKDEYIKGLPEQLKMFSSFLGKNKWFAGDNISYADFLIYEMLDQHELFAPKCLDEFSNLKEFVQKFRALPNIEKYMKSDKFLKWPLNNTVAKFGSSSTPYPKN